MDSIYYLIAFILVAIFGFIRLSNLQTREYSLGLPQGSVRAILALLVISVFVAAIVTITDAAMEPQELVTLNQVNGERLKVLLADPKITILSEGQLRGTVYPEVIVLINKSPDLATHLEILIGALVALVSSLSGYYFGNRGSFTTNKKVESQPPKQTEVQSSSVAPITHDEPAQVIDTDTVKNEAELTMYEVNALQKEIARSQLKPEKKTALVTKLKKARAALVGNDVTNAQMIIEEVNAMRSQRTQTE